MRFDESLVLIVVVAVAVASAGTRMTSLGQQHMVGQSVDTFVNLYNQIFEGMLCFVGFLLKGNKLYTTNSLKIS